jgi:hypothetical protein
MLLDGAMNVSPENPEILAPVKQFLRLGGTIQSITKPTKASVGSATKRAYPDMVSDIAIFSDSLRA